MTVTVSEETTLCPTKETYTGFQKAYEFLNRNSSTVSCQTA
jgi:hypothetical protein